MKKPPTKTKTKAKGGELELTGITQEAPARKTSGGKPQTVKARPPGNANKARKKPQFSPDKQRQIREFRAFSQWDEWKDLPGWEALRERLEKHPLGEDWLKIDRSGAMVPGGPGPYRFGAALERVLNWPDPPDDLELPELLPDIAPELLRQVRLGVAFLKRLAVAYSSSELDLTHWGLREFVLWEWSEQANEEGRALKELHELHRKSLSKSLLPFVAIKAGAPGNKDKTKQGWVMQPRTLYSPMDLSLLLALALDELFELVTDPQLGLRRCSALLPRGQMQCNRWLMTQPVGRPREYCSDPCRQRAGREKREGDRRKKLQTAGGA
jgi:hypothetical protein